MRGKTITYIGWVGHANMGDEALYRSNQVIFKNYRFVPDNVKQHSKITLFGGGTVLPHWPMSVLPNKYNYAYGVGVRNPSFFGEFHPLCIEQLKRFNFRFLGVRGDTSRWLLEKWGLKSEVVGDPCLVLEPTRYDKKRSTKIGVNVGISRGVIWGGDERRILKETSELCRKLTEEGYRPVLIPFWKEDLPYIREIGNASDVEIFGNWMNMQELLDELASCHLIIGEKLHALVFSASTYTPFISMEYRPKCRDFAETMGFGDYNIRTDEMTAKRVFAMFCDLLNNWDEMRKRLVEKVNVYRQRLEKSACLIKNDIDSLPDDKWSPRHLSIPRWVLHKYGGIIRLRIS